MLNQIDLSRADLNLLVLFEILMEERHVGRAAERLILSPSAVSPGLRRLRRLLNDPLFLKTPKGEVPTARAAELAAPVADILARVRGVVSGVAPFDPLGSGRRFVIGAPDGVSAVILPALFAALGERAPCIDVAVRRLLPVPGETSPERAWRSAFAELDARALDVAIIPSDEVPARFLRRLLFEEDFVVAARGGHPFGADPTLDRYREARHLVVSLTGDAHGFVDQVLAAEGRSRRVALTVPNFMFALAAVADTDLLSALPRRLVSMHAARFGGVGVEAPVPLGRFPLNAVASKAAMMDEGVSWLLDLLRERIDPMPGAGATA